MQKDLRSLYIKHQIKCSINHLDEKRLYILYFSYYNKWGNLIKNPLMIFTKFYNFLKGFPAIDHVAHISKFNIDNQGYKWNAEIFEATIERGVETNNLLDKLKAFKGICYIESINIPFDHYKSASFITKYNGMKYSRISALISGLDFYRVDHKINTRFKQIGAFCSWLESLFLIDQGVDLSNIENGNPALITPADLYRANLGDKCIFFKS